MLDDWASSKGEGKSADKEPLADPNDPAATDESKPDNKPSQTATHAETVVTDNEKSIEKND